MPFPNFNIQPQPDPFDWSQYGGAGTKQLFNNSGAFSGGNVPQVQQGLDTFKTLYKNLTGQDPSQDDIGNFAKNALYGAWTAPGDMNYSDTSNLANNYIQNSFGPQIAQNQRTQAETQLGHTQQMIQDLIGKQVAASTADITNPNSNTYRTFAGNMNNLGITPSSGAFQAGLGGELGKTTSNAINSALGAVGLPAISGIQGSTSYPFDVSSKFNDLSHLNSMTDFGLQSALASKFAQDAEPSGFEKNLGYANTASGIFKNLFGGGGGGGSSSSSAAGAKAALTYICTALWRNKILAVSEVNRLHEHLFKALPKRFFKFLQYFVLGKFIAMAAEYVKVDWHEWRSSFYDTIIAEPDPVKAVDMYGESCWKLVAEVKVRLRRKLMPLYHPGVI